MINNIKTANNFFIKKKTFLTLFFLGLIIISGIAGAYTQFEVKDAVTSIPKVISWVSKNLIPFEIEGGKIIPDQRAVSRIPKILNKLGETIVMSIVATMFSAILSFCIAILGSRTTRLNLVLSGFARAFSSVCRNIPIAAWAMIFLISFGQSAFTGFLALFFYSLGFQSRVFMETIDETSSSSVEALRATGSSYNQVIAQAVVPSSLPQILSWILYMIETNIRSATLVGILTGSGIGFYFSVYYKSMQYKSASLIVISIMVVVLLIETTSNTLRRIIL